MCVCVEGRWGILQTFQMHQQKLSAFYTSELCEILEGEKIEKLSKQT